MKNTTGILYLLTFTILLSLNLHGQRSPIKKEFPESGRTFYEKVLSELSSIPGFSIAVVKGDKTVFMDGFGQADIENQVPSTPHTDYYIASSTKAFTALLAALLDEKGIIGLDDQVISFFPDVEFDPGVHMSKIRIRDLLNHTSGINNNGISFRAAYSGDHDLKTMVELMQYCEANEVGYGNYEYTNVGYNIYSIIVDKVTGKKWQDWLEELVFDPLGMTQTSAYISKAEKNGWPLAKPYAGVTAENIESVYLMKQDNTMQAAGGLITTAADLARWIKIQLNDGKLDGNQIISPSIIRASQSSTIDITDRAFPYEGNGYGLGWEIGSYEGNEVVYGFGGFPGFYTHVSFMPDRKLGVAVMVNDAVSGYYLMNLLANYTYDAMMEIEGVEEKYDAQLKEFAKQLEQESASIQKGRKKRAKRTWQLSKPFPAYSGIFVNEEMGTIKITGSQDKIKVEMGNMYCIATPFIKDETIRVELRPHSGKVIGFEWDVDELKGIHTGGTFFEKAK